MPNNDRDDAEMIISGFIICGCLRSEAEQILVLYGIESGFSRLDQKVIQTLQQRFGWSEVDAQQHFDSKGLIRVLEDLKTQPPPSNTNFQQYQQTNPTQLNLTNEQSITAKFTSSFLGKIIVGVFGGAVCGSIILTLILSLIASPFPVWWITQGAILGGFNGLLIGTTYSISGKYLNNGSHFVYKIGIIGLFFGLVTTVFNFLFSYFGNENTLIAGAFWHDALWEITDHSKIWLYITALQSIFGFFTGLCLGIIYRLK